MKISVEKSNSASNVVQLIIMYKSACLQINTFQEIQYLFENRFVAVKKKAQESACTDQYQMAVMEIELYKIDWNKNHPNCFINGSK